MRSDLTSHIRHFIYGKRKTLKDLQCNRDQFLQWFNFQFKESMTCDEWEVDHVIPLSMFDLKVPTQHSMACHWSNLRPVTPEENKAKSDKIKCSDIYHHMSIINSFLRTHGNYQTSVETCWWLRLQLKHGENVQDDEELKTLLKWIIRSEPPKPSTGMEIVQRLNNSGSKN